MRDRTEQILRYACLILAVLILAKFIGTGFHVAPFMGIKIPAVPTLKTNSVSSLNQTSATKPPTAISPAAALPEVSTAKAKTNALINLSTNLAAIKRTGTNLISTNLVTRAGTNGVGTRTGTNNNLAVTTNSRPPITQRPRPMMMAGGMGFAGMSGMPGMSGNLPALAPEIQARVDKIVSSEIFAPVMHPLPMALLGIAGDTVFLRTDSGQTGLVKPGDSLGNVKVLSIGINRVLVELGGQKRELTIFDGSGSDSLLSQTDKSSK
jgi:hypothetical protein